MADWTIEQGTRSTQAWEYALGRDIKVTGLGEFQLKLQTLMPEVRKALEAAIRKDANAMRDRARAMASGDVLKSVSGRYVASIQSRMTSSATGVFGYVSSDDPRAGLFEWGGSTPARDILPNVAQALLFKLGFLSSKFAAIVHRPVVNYKPHPVINAAFDVMEQTVEHDIESAASSIVIDHGIL